MVAIASIAGDFGAAVGALAGMIAVTGFVAHAGPVLREGSEHEVRQAMVRGGLAGLGVATAVIVLSAIVSIINQ